MSIKGFRLVIFISIVMFLGYILVSVFNNPIPDTRQTKTNFRLNDDELFGGENSNSGKNNSLYIEKAIEVRGVIKDLTKNDDSYTLYLQGEGDNGILCEMQDDFHFNDNKVELGDTVIVKGVYKGHLLDAILLNCILVSENLNE